MTIDSSLKALRDVDGVLGSFVVNVEGSLVARDMSQLFDDDVLHDVGVRVRRMMEGLVESGEIPSSVALTFNDHRLWLRSVDSYTLCVLSATQINRPALRMALTLVSRRVAPLLPLQEAEEAREETARGNASAQPQEMAPPVSTSYEPDTLVSFSKPAPEQSAPSPRPVPEQSTPLSPRPASPAAKKAMWRGRPV